MTLPRSSPRRSATLWDRSWCELPLKSTMLGISDYGERLALMRKKGMMQKKRKGEQEEATGLRLRCWRTGRLGGASVAAGRALPRGGGGRSCARQEGKWLPLIGRAISPQELTELLPRFKLNTPAHARTHTHTHRGRLFNVLIFAPRLQISTRPSYTFHFSFRTYFCTKVSTAA